MKIEQLYTGCLAQAAYYIESEGEACIIDPLREVDQYVRRAEKDEAKIKYVFETHFHADFVSGHIDLARKTGAKIVFGPTAQPEFEAYIASDGEQFRIGKITIEVLHTPGHTMESVVYLLKDQDGTPHAIFTGDTLFLGDVGRPDLAQKNGLYDARDLAGMLYDSLQNKIMPLPDDVIVYPAHGAGSACGKNMMKETVDTLGNQKQMNYALRAESKEKFIEEVTDGLLSPPEYFPHNVSMNKKGYASFDNVVEKSLTALNPDAFEQTANTSDAVILDTRPASQYMEAAVPRSVNIGLDGQFAPWVGAMIVDVQYPILLVTEPGKEKETVTRLSRVGFDNVLGYLDGGLKAWTESGKGIDQVEQITPEDFVKVIEHDSDITIFDVRKENEFNAGHLDNAVNLPLDNINNWSGDIDERKHFYIHCAGGYRSMIAASILKARGIHKFTEVKGGYGAISKLMVH